MTTSDSTKKSSLLRRLGERLWRRPQRRGPEIDYDQFVGVEHHGEVVLVLRRDGGRRPITFESVRHAAAWFARVQSGLLARREELGNPPHLAQLADRLSAVMMRKWATPEHVLSFLVTGLSHASVSAATFEFTDSGLVIRCRRYGRLHLGGTMSRRQGRALLSLFGERLGETGSERLVLNARFPGPALMADVQLQSSHIKVEPVLAPGLFTDLESWGATMNVAQATRELLGRGPGLLLIAGRRDSGKSTVAAICQTEAETLERESLSAVPIDEIDNAETAQEALALAARQLVIATIRAESASEALAWLKSQGLPHASLRTAVGGVLETTLLSVECGRCAGEGCDRCQRCGVITRRGHLDIARLESVLNERDTIPPFERERRKLTA